MIDALRVFFLQHLKSHESKSAQEQEYATPLIGVWHGGIPSHMILKGTFLVNYVRAHFENRKTIAAHEKRVLMQEVAWLVLDDDVRLFSPSKSVFLQSTLLSLVVCVCLLVT